MCSGECSLKVVASVSPLSDAEFEAPVSGEDMEDLEKAALPSPMLLAIEKSCEYTSVESMDPQHADDMSPHSKSVRCVWSRIAPRANDGDFNSIPSDRGLEDGV